MHKTILFLMLMIMMTVINCFNKIEQPIVEYEVRDEGGTLRLMWQPVDDADGYNIYSWTDSIGFTADTVFDVTIPCWAVSVATVIGNDYSIKSGVDIGWSGSYNRSMWNPLDPDSGAIHALWITESGQLITCSIYNTYYDTLYNFFLKNVSSHLWLHNRSATGETNKLATCSLTIFHDVKIAEALGPNYNDSVEVVDGGIYFVFLDNNSNGYDTDVDRFLKLKIDSIVDGKIWLKGGNQHVPGLRWLVTFDHE